MFLCTGFVAAQKPVPLFLGLNFNGNHTIHSDPGILLSEQWMRNNEAIGNENNRATERTRGASAGRWCVEQVLARGYGLATIYYPDVPRVGSLSSHRGI